MHGRKKRVVEISAEELKKKQEQGEKIGNAISEFLAFRKDLSKVQDPLGYTGVMVNFCPEINSIYNLRREVIQNMIQGLSLPERYAFLLKELKTLLPIMK
jgi:hypothetical protein